MRTSIILAGMMIANSINLKWHGDDKSVISFTAIILTFAVFFDIIDFIRNNKK